MTDLITNISPMIAGIFGWAGDVAGIIVETPLLLMTTGIMVAGAAVGIFGRLISRN